MFGAFVVKKWHFPPESPEFRRKVAEFRPEFPEFRFLNLNSPSVRKMRFSAEFRPEFRFRWSPGFVKKRKGEPWFRVAVGVIEIGRFVPFWLRFLLGLGYRALLACPVLWIPRRIRGPKRSFQLGAGRQFLAAFVLQVSSAAPSFPVGVMRRRENDCFVRVRRRPCAAS